MGTVPGVRGRGSIVKSPLLSHAIGYATRTVELFRAIGISAYRQSTSSLAMRPTNSHGRAWNPRRHFTVTLGHLPCRTFSDISGAFRSRSDPGAQVIAFRHSLPWPTR